MQLLLHLFLTHTQTVPEETWTKHLSKSFKNQVKCTIVNKKKKKKGLYRML